MKIILSIYIVLYSAYCFSQNTKKITLEDVWSKYSFYTPSSPDITPIKNNEFVFLYNNALLKLPFTHKEINKIAKFPDSLSVSDFVINPNNTDYLLAVNANSIRRDSYSAVFYYFNSVDNSISPLINDSILIQNPQFSPNGKTICYFFENNLYLFENNKIIQITKDGVYNEIINGMPDWVYEEEFSMHSAFTWNSNSKYISYLQFNETEVPLYQLPFYNGPYPEYTNYKYPKVGESISAVAPMVYNIHTHTNEEVILPFEFDYVPEMQWVDSVTIAYTLLDRFQKNMQIVYYNVLSKKASLMFEHSEKTYVSVPTFFTPIKNTSDFIIVLPNKKGENIIQLISKRKAKPLLKNRSVGEVTDVYGVSEKNKIYFQATGLNPINRYVFSVDLEYKLDTIFGEDGTNSARFNADFTYCIHDYSNAKQEVTSNVTNAIADVMYTWTKNFWVQDAKQMYAMTEKEFFTIPTLDNDSLFGWVIKPNDFVESKKYPVILSVYGGPLFQKVTNSASYDYFWYQFLAQNGYIVISVDCRGSYARNNSFSKESTYLNLGEQEVNDFKRSVEYLSRNFNYIDSTKIGIEGWSYGGYMALLNEAKCPNTFAASVAIAPVVNWLNYDATYTERFMMTDYENPSGYENSNVLNYVKNINSPILLIHGTYDDNVHPQNTYELMNEFIKYNIDYEFVCMPNDTHGMFGLNSRYFMYNKIFKFYELNLK